MRAEGTPGGFAGVYPVLRALEESGRARRGWFVAGLGAAQFALPGAVDRLRAHRNPSTPTSPAASLVLAATDPAQPYGAALSLARADRRRPPVTRRRARTSCSSTASASRISSAAATACSRSATRVDDDPRRRGSNAIVEAHKEGRLGRLQIERIDDEPARTSPHAAALRAAGFADGYKGLTLHK